MSDGKQNLTGVWHGLYTYPGGTSVAFVATLIEAGSHLNGSTHEPCILPAPRTECKHLSGADRGSAAPADDTPRTLEEIDMAHLLRVLFREYPTRSVLGATMMITQSFLYNAIFFTATLVLGKF